MYVQSTARRAAIRGAIRVLDVALRITKHAHATLDRCDRRLVTWQRDLWMRVLRERAIAMQRRAEERRTAS